MYLYRCVAAVAVQVPLPSACPVVIVLLLFVPHDEELKVSKQRHSLTGTLCCAAQSRHGKQHKCSGKYDELLQIKVALIKWTRDVCRACACVRA